MPTSEQIDGVRDQVDALTKEQYRGFTEWKYGRLLCEWAKEQDWDDGKEGTYLRSWDELDEHALADVMRYVKFDGFTEEQITVFKNNVIAEKSDFLEGIEPHQLDIPPDAYDHEYEEWREWADAETPLLHEMLTEEEIDRFFEEPDQRELDSIFLGMLTLEEIEQLEVYESCEADDKSGHEPFAGLLTPEEIDAYHALGDTKILGAEQQIDREVGRLRDAGEDYERYLDQAARRLPANDNKRGRERSR